MYRERGEASLLQRAHGRVDPVGGAAYENERATVRGGQRMPHRRTASNRVGDFARAMAVVLLQMGGPRTLDDLRPFLEELFSDPDIIQWPRLLRPFQRPLARAIAKRRAPRMMPRYAAIGGGSPILAHTREQARLLSAALTARGRPELVELAMRYTEPRATSAVSRLAAEPEITLLPLYPHWSRATTGSSVADLVSAAREAGYAGSLHLIRSWGEHPAYVDLLAQQAEDAVARLRKDTSGPVHLLFSAHGLPRRYVERGDPYPREVEATARRVGARVGAEAWSLAYQSAVGPVEWLRPYTNERLLAIARDGARAVCCVPLGFVSDHIETLYDIDVSFAALARENGMAWARTPSFNGSAAFAGVLADVLGDTPREAAA